jgi:serine/threonine protein kinase
VSIALCVRRGTSPKQQQQQQGKFCLCAYKTLTKAWDLRNNTLLPAVRNEIQALQRLSGEGTHPHPNIVALLAVTSSSSSLQSQSTAMTSMIPPSLTLVLDFATVDLGVVLEYYRRAGRLMSWNTIHSVAADIQTGLIHCHTHGVIHCDVKPGNLLLHATTGHWQLCDFGICHIQEDQFHQTESTTVTTTPQQPPTALGTLFYRPPEVLLGAPAIHPSVDIYAAGCVVGECVHTGRPLFASGSTNNDLSQLTAIFALLGTPNTTTWATVADDAPDWGKLAFTDQPPMPWSTWLPRVTEPGADAYSTLFPWLTQSVQLNPHQRQWNTEALKDVQVDRAAMVRECQLLAPPVVLGSTDSVNQPPPIAHLAAWAEKRRNILTHASSDVPFQIHSSSSSASVSESPPNKSPMPPYDDLFIEIVANPPSTSDQVEDCLHRLLSTLATLSSKKVLSAKEIWSCLYNSNKSSSLPHKNAEGGDTWLTRLHLLGYLLHEYETMISPFELLNCAIQASVFAESSQATAFANLCVLLCCYALRKCPPWPVISRPKRWRSCLFETVRICQRELTSFQVEILIDIVFPSCLYVRDALAGTCPKPESIPWLQALPCCLAQMIVSCALRETNASVVSREQKDRFCHGVEVATGGNFVLLLQARYFVEDEIRSTSLTSSKWLHIWMYDVAEEDDYEVLASADPKIDQTGLALLSYYWLDWWDRPQVFTGPHLWHLLFPSVSILLHADDDIYLQHCGFLLLQRLLSLVQNASLPSTSPRRLGHPIGTIQLLSNRMVADVANRQGEQKEGTSSILPSGSEAFQMIKMLLTKYHPVQQACLTRKLHQDCPHQGLKPKLMDLFRNIVRWCHYKTAQKLAWTYLESCLLVLEKYVHTNQHGVTPAVISDFENLVTEAEDFVALMGIFRLWKLMRKQSTGIPELPNRLLFICKALSNTLSMHKTKNLFQLELLLDSVQLVLEEEPNADQRNETNDG